MTDCLLVGGSPPHTRGILSSSCLPSSRSGITPAYAGNTISMTSALNFCWDHPRIRGEYDELNHSSTSPAGSPPHTRGILEDTANSIGKIGITPAYAGNTMWRCCRATRPWDHPRIRGEYTLTPPTGKTFQGSPPHTRGIQMYQVSSLAFDGITPAYAGNTAQPAGYGTYPWDHPRIRGEYTKNPKCTSTSNYIIMDAKQRPMSFTLMLS